MALVTNIRYDSTQCLTRLRSKAPIYTINVQNNDINTSLIDNDIQQMSSNINYTFAKYSMLRNEGKEQDQGPKKFQMIIVVFLPSYCLLLTVKFDKKI